MVHRNDMHKNVFKEINVFKKHNVSLHSTSNILRHKQNENTTK